MAMLVHEDRSSISQSEIPNPGDSQYSLWRNSLIHAPLLSHIFRFRSAFTGKSREEVHQQFFPLQCSSACRQTTLVSEICYWTQSRRSQSSRHSAVPCLTLCGKFVVGGGDPIEVHIGSLALPSDMIQILGFDHVQTSQPYCVFDSALPVKDAVCDSVASHCMILPTNRE